MKRRFTVADRTRLHRVAIRMLAQPAGRSRPFTMWERRAILFRWRPFRGVRR